ncbi:hypothetical protein [Conyzicola sp.]|uniref:hypothetical protein n=1 Tax=Conyzicola sp. TaxID=1969404 RepID=UPI00398A0106
MRWDSLFDDLEGQLEQELRAEELDEHAEEERLRIGRLSVRDRLQAIHDGARHDGADHDGAQHDRDRAVRVILNSGEHVTVRPLSFGRDWLTAQLLGETRRAAQCVLPLAAISSLVLTRAQVELSLAPGSAQPPAESTLASRLTLPFVLRDLCRRRAPIDVRTALGDVHGTIDRVGRDHLDLATHGSDRPRRESAVIDYRTIPLHQVLLVRL